MLHGRSALMNFKLFLNVCHVGTHLYVKEGKTDRKRKPLKEPFVN